MANPFRAIAYHLLNSLATSSFEWYKGSSNALIAALFALVFTSRNVPLSAAAASILLSIPLIRKRTPLHIAVFSLLPALPALVIGLIFASLDVALASFAKAYTVSALTLAASHYVNVSEAAYIAEKIRRGSSQHVGLVFKSLPQTLKEMEEALLVAELKGVELWRGVAAATLAAYEHGVLHEEGLYTKEIRRASPKYSTKALGYTALVVLVLAALNLIV